MDTEKKLTPFLTEVGLFIIIVVIFCFIISLLANAANPYPTEYNWWTDHEMLHYPGVSVSPAFVNTSCDQHGNVRPPHGDNIAQVQWLGGKDSVFVANFKIVYGNTEMIVPTPQVGECIYLFNTTGNITVYGQDSSSGGWIKLGSGAI